jgi:hypothetical protein
MEEVKNFISTLMIAVSNCSLYSKRHEAFDKLTEKVFSMLNSIMEEQFEIMIIENELIINNTPLREAGLYGANLIKRLKLKGISRVDFQKGFALSEIRQFIVDLSERGTTLKSYPHIKTGIVDVNISRSKIHSDSGLAGDFDPDSSSQVSSEDMAKLKEIFHSASPFKTINVIGLEEVVVNFIANFKREANIFKILSPVKSHSEYTYTHTTNVAILSVFQAQSLGVSDGYLHEIGISALLHDTGKMFISKEILNKKGRLDEREFNEIKKHPVHGARYLAKMDGLARLAPVIAFEHHMKYDGSGYPQFSLYNKKQHIFSQMVAISDFFDALRSRRPYRGSLDTKNIIEMMKKGAGVDFSPFLVKHFTDMLLTSSAGSQGAIADSKEKKLERSK